MLLQIVLRLTIVEGYISVSPHIPLSLFEGTRTATGTESR